MQSIKFELFSFIFLLILACILTLSHTQFGLLISMDSLQYFKSASNFYQGHGLSLQVEGVYQAITLWPPLYPFILSQICELNTCRTAELEQYSIWLNLFMLLVSLTIIYLIIRKLSNKWLALIGTLVYLILPGTQIIFMYAWSEVIFIPLILCSFLLLNSFISQPEQKKFLFLAIFFVIIATYVRYISIAYCIALLLSILFFSEGGLLKRFKLTITSGLLYSFGIFPLLLRNFFLTGHFSGGERGTPDFRLFDDIISLFSLFNSELFSSYLIISLTFFLLLLLTIIILIKQSKQSIITSQTFKLTVTLPLLWFLVYLLFLLFSRNIQIIDLDARMLAVNWPFLIFFLTGFYTISQRKNIIQLSLVYNLLFITTIVYTGIQAHKTILSNLEKTREAGNINGIYYPSINSKAIDFIRELAKKLKLNQDDSLLTDFSRPIILDYIFDAPIIKSIGIISNKKFDYHHLQNQHGLLLLFNYNNYKQLVSDYNGKVQFYTFRNNKNQLQYLAIKLPLPKLTD